MSEEEALIKAQLAKLFTEALLSDAGTAWRSHFTTLIAGEIRGQISETMTGHQNRLRAEADQLHRDLVATLSAQRSKMRQDFETYAALPVAAGSAQPVRTEAAPVEDEVRAAPEADIAPGPKKHEPILKTSAAPESESAPTPPADESDARRPLAFLGRAGAGSTLAWVAALVVAVLAGIGIGWTAFGRPAADSAGVATLEQICTTFRDYRSEPAKTTPKGSETASAQDVGGTAQASPFSPVEQKLAAACLGAVPVTANSAAPPADAVTATPAN
jgi:hypothetical protein